MNGANETSLLVAVLAVAWLAVAAFVTVIAARRLRVAQQVIASAQTSKLLLERSPARALVVLPDGKIEADRLLLRDLGIEGRADRLADLGSGEDKGIKSADLDSLTEAIEAARSSAGPLALKVHAAGSDRVFEVMGGPAPASEPAGSLLLWLVDTSPGEEERAKLAMRLRQTDSALNSLTQLIEAAPFPMWYRGPDLKLGLVNSAYVQAVEGQDASDVIARGSELVEGIGEDGLELAQKAQSSGRVQGGLLQTRVPRVTRPPSR